jgi:hypothetical protein
MVSARPRQGLGLWFERMMALIAVANLGLVGFDLTYVMWRNFWLQGTVALGPVKFHVPLPPITPGYDPVKGISEHRDTQKYLDSVAALKQELQQNGVGSAGAQDKLKDLRTLSTEMIQTNPFSSANKSGTLEKIKRLMREHVYGVKEAKDASARKAFDAFWSQESLSAKGVDPELKFFDEQIQPLIATNYYRSISENGEPTDWFGLIDAPFVALFGLEFLARTFLLTRRHRGLKWLDAMTWRWYDLLLLLPFWRWLRIIPVLMRLDDARLISLARIRAQATQGLVVNIAEELTAAVVAQLIGQLQGGLQQGGLARRLLQSVDKPYVDLNQKDELQEIVAKILKVTVYEVLPKIQPEVEAVLRHPIGALLDQSPGYSLFKTVPLLGGVPDRVNEQVITTATTGAYKALTLALEDKEAAMLISQLIRSFTKTLVTELQSGKTLDELQGLVNDLLEEVKVNYVEQGPPVEVVKGVGGRSVRRIAPR